MITHFLLYLLIIVQGSSHGQESFREKQMQYARVRTAYNEYFTALRSEIDSMSIGDFDLFLRAFKVEKLVEVWIKDKEAERFHLFRTYDICSSSGRPGPKRRSGDFQVPEGFYHINIFNPYSNFYLSLGINYPNRSDRILGDPDHPDRKSVV